MPKYTISNLKGFTLIEILISVTLVSILAGLLISVINPAGLRAKARDSQRKADLKQIQTALELYFADNRQYPFSSPTCGAVCQWRQVNGSNPLETALETGQYINKVPLDPKLAGTNNGPCNNIESNRYNYLTSADGSQYILTSIMENSGSNDEASCLDLNNWLDGNVHSSGNSVCATVTFTAEDYCYGVENP